MFIFPQKHRKRTQQTELTLETWSSYSCLTSPGSLTLGGHTATTRAQSYSLSSVYTQKTGNSNMDLSSACFINKLNWIFCTSQVILHPTTLPTEALLTMQMELVLDLIPELLVDQRFVTAVLSGPCGNSLPTQRTAQSGFIHRLQETAL